MRKGRSVRKLTDGFFYVIGESTPYDMKTSTGGIAMEQKGILPQKRPTADGEAHRRDFFADADLEESRTFCPVYPLD